MARFLIPEGDTEINVVKMLHKKKVINFKLEEKDYPIKEDRGKAKIPVRFVGSIAQDIDNHHSNFFDQSSRIPS